MLILVDRPQCLKEEWKQRRYCWSELSFHSDQPRLSLSLFSLGLSAMSCAKKEKVLMRRRVCGSVEQDSAKTH